MLYNDETKKVLERSGLGWVIPLLPEDIRSFTVELIDLDILSRGPKGSTGHSSGYFYPSTRLFLFDGMGKQLTEVGGERKQPVEYTEFRLWKRPFFFKVVEMKRINVFETVEAALERLDDDAANSVRFIVDIPLHSRQVEICKLRRSDKDLRTRLQEKADEAVAKFHETLES